MRIKDYEQNIYDYDPTNGPKVDHVYHIRKSLDRIFKRKPGDKEWKFDQFKKKEKQCE
jgi:hypothetical protein